MAIIIILMKTHNTTIFFLFIDIFKHKMTSSNFILYPAEFSKMQSFKRILWKHIWDTIHSNFYKEMYVTGASYIAPWNYATQSYTNQGKYL